MATPAIVACTPEFRVAHHTKRADQRIQGPLPHANPRQDGDQHAESRRQTQPSQGYVGAVEDGDDEDRSDVVDDRQRQQEEAEPVGHPLADQGHHADGEGDVGGHRYAPALHVVAAQVETQVDQRRNDHPADCRHDRQHHVAHPPKPADHHLALDLQTHHEEEQRHERVVHEAVEVFVEDDEIAQLDLDQRVPEVLVAVADGRVHPDQGGGRRKQQEDPAGRLDVQEVLQRPADRPGERTVAPDEGQALIGRQRLRAVVVTVADRRVEGPRLRVPVAFDVPVIGHEHSRQTLSTSLAR